MTPLRPYVRIALIVWTIVGLMLIAFFAVNWRRLSNLAYENVEWMKAERRYLEGQP